MTKLSLREQKKHDTKVAIIEAATELFIDKGFNKTTLADIAESANVSPRTIFSYFESKEAIILDEAQERVNFLSEQINTRGNTSVLGVLQNMKVDESDGDPDANLELILSTPELKNHFSSMLTDIESLIAENLGEERGLSKDSIQVQLIAATCRAAITHVLNNPTDTDSTRVALDFINGGLNATS